MDAWWLIVPVAYVVGTFPTARLVAATRGHDPTAEGSGNPGASNVYRVAGARAGAVVLVGDIAKGFVPALVGLVVAGSGLGLAAGFAAVAGHIAPWSRLRHGGKGVATMGGTALALYPLVALALLAIWALVLRRFRVASVASLLMVVLLPLGVVAMGRPTTEVVAVAAACAVVAVRHRANIGRLLRGTEHAIG